MTHDEILATGLHECASDCPVQPIRKRQWDAVNVSLAVAFLFILAVGFSLVTR